ncbi:MAG: hypothetical protein O2984_00205 [Bacteroidetes bacterium]|jgi:hypothetical protein|nr:hypothetical protein [Bacteroidota bacterium]
MRVIGDIPHHQMKITVFSWNNKYHIKFEIGQFEQTYKIGSMDLMGMDDINKMIDEEFLDSIMQRFLEMRTSFQGAFQRLNS